MCLAKPLADILNNFVAGSTLEDILAAVRDQPDSIGADVEDDDDEDSDTSGEEEKDQVSVGPA